MTILVAGANGFAGSAIVKELTRIGRPVFGISSKDVDLLDRNATFNYLNQLKPNGKKVNFYEIKEYLHKQSWQRIVFLIKKLPKV